MKRVMASITSILLTLALLMGCTAEQPPTGSGTPTVPAASMETAQPEMIANIA